MQPIARLNGVDCCSEVVPVINAKIEPKTWSVTEILKKTPFVESSDFQRFQKWKLSLA